MRIKTIFLFLSLIALLFCLIFPLVFYLSLPDVTYLKHHNPTMTAFMRLRKEQYAAQGKKLLIRQRWVSFDTIPDLLKKSIRISEDAAFYSHEGVDFDELKASIERNLEEGALVRGGSTITQQLAKNLYLSPDKSFFRKIKEYFIAKRLEAALSKNRIFSLYLNVIELGHGVFGVDAAANYYFNTPVQDLNFDEIVRLAAIVPKPLRVNPRGNSGWLKWKTAWIIEKLILYKYIDADKETLIDSMFPSEQG